MFSFLSLVGKIVFFEHALKISIVKILSILHILCCFSPSNFFASKAMKVLWLIAGIHDLDYELISAYKVNSAYKQWYK